MFSFITKPIGCLFSLVGSIVVIALVLVLLGLGLLSHFMPQIGAKAISEASGFPASVGSSSFSIWKQRLELRDIRIDNPDNYPEDDFLAIPLLSLRLDRKASDQEHLTLSEVTLHIDTLTLVRQSGTAVNGSALIINLLQNASLSPTAQGATPQPAAPQTGAQQPAFAGSGSATAPSAGHLPEGPAQEPNPLVRFELPPAPIAGLPALVSLPVSYDAAGKPFYGERPRWLIRSLTIRIDNARLFASSPQGNFLQLVPLQYERTFDNVTSLREVLPFLLQDLIRRGLPL